MKKIVTVLLLLNLYAFTCAKNYNDKYCSNTKKSFITACQTTENKIDLTEKIYQKLCIPYLSTILNNEDAVFIKFNKKYDNSPKNILNSHDWKITKDTLVKCI